MSQGAKGLRGGGYRSTSMHGITYMHVAPLTVTDKQLQPLRSNNTVRYMHL
jgi:hypothetical protein